MINPPLLRGMADCKCCRLLARAAQPRHTSSCRTPQPKAVLSTPSCSTLCQHTCYASSHPMSIGIASYALTCKQQQSDVSSPMRSESNLPDSSFTASSSPSEEHVRGTHCQPDAQPAWLACASRPESSQRWSRRGRRMWNLPWAAFLSRPERGSSTARPPPACMHAACEELISV